MNKFLLNVLLTPGILVRVPLVILVWWVLPALICACEWLADNVFIGWRP